jgi:hypothetical protein
LRLRFGWNRDGMVYPLILLADFGRVLASGAGMWGVWWKSWRYFPSLPSTGRWGPAGIPRCFPREGEGGTNYHRGFRMPERERGLGGLRTGDFLGGCGVLRYNPLYRRISE